MRGELFAEFTHVVGGGVVIFVEGDEDVGVAGADEAGRGVHVIDAAVGEADVVGDGVEFAVGNDAADGGFDFVAELGGFFDAGAGFCAEVEDELAAVRAGEEILAEPGDEEKEGEASEKESRDEDTNSRMGKSADQSLLPGAFVRMASAKRPQTASGLGDHRQWAI